MIAKKGTPDGGIECFCRLEDGQQEWGWQSKFFLTRLDGPRWKQFDRSVETALEAHPNLVRYYVCVPHDRSDSRRQGVTTEMQRWESRVEKWEGWARERGMAVEFVWWGESELWDRLSLDRQAGRLRFWFGSAGPFSDEWFEKHHQRAVDLAGPRYTPEVHVDVPLVEDFELFGRSESAVVAVRRLAKEIRQGPISMLVRRVGEDMLDDMPELCGVDESVDLVVRALSDMRCPPNEKWRLSTVMSQVNDARRRVEECRAPLAAAADEHKMRGVAEGIDRGYRTNPYRDAAYQVDALESALWNIGNRIERLDGVVNGDLMIVTGDAGFGKTHLLCDIAARRLAENRPTVLLMGQQFITTEHPWTQASAQLDLKDLTMEEFVGALEAAAQETDSRALFMIDAINEGEGQEIWPAHLAGFVTQLSASPWIGVVLSVRTAHINYSDIVPQQVRASAYEVQHRGFADSTYDAVKRFCDHYGLDFPTTPLLRPEFESPLFLKTLCKGLQDSQQRTIPVGSEGISRVFGRYLDKIDEDLAKRLDYDPHGAIVSQALNAVAAQLAQERTRWLSRRQVQDLVNPLASASGYSRSLYRALVDNGLLMEVPHSRRGEDWFVHFGYEWFADYLIAGHLIDRCEDPEELASVLAGDGTDSHEVMWAPWNTLLEALGVLLPERLEIELPEVLADSGGADYVRSAFLKGLRWRDPTTVGPACRGLIEDLIAGVQYGDIVDIFDALVICAVTPHHPLGSAFLDGHLRRFEMPDRDAVWSRYLHLAYSKAGPVNRLLDWAEKHLGHASRSDRATSVACATVLAWFLAASHRFVRDRATKGLVAVLGDDIGLTCELVRRFDDVDDPYVRERVMAAAYGAAMRSTDAEALAPLADLVYRLVFAHGEPPAHILLRDYARGVIERAHHVGAELTFDATLADPPYRSEWPHIPEVTELKQFEPSAGDRQRELTSAERAQWFIHSSVMNWDFARYIIGTNLTSKSNRWLSLQNTDPLWQSGDELATSFRCSLTPASRSVFDELWGGTRTVESIISLVFVDSGGNGEPHDTDESPFAFPVEEQYLEPQLEESFIAMLSEQQKAAYVEVKTARGTSAPGLSLDIIQRYVLWRVFDLGWTPERFGDLDRRIASSPSHAAAGRGTHKPERIGKKYQWIAYHEILAHISDRYQYRVPYDDAGPQNGYRGTWQLSVRDIDPSALFTGAPPDRKPPEGRNKWWSHEAPIAPIDDIDHEQWLKRQSDIPEYEQQLCFANPQDGSTWIKLQGIDTWKSPVPPDQDGYKTDRREIWLDACGYLIDAAAVDEFIAWSKTVDFWNRWMTQPPVGHELFFGELGWSFAFKALASDSLEPQHPAPRQGTPCPTPLRTTALEYTTEGSGYDCSIVEGYNLYRPSSQLVNAMNLSWTGHGADFVDSDGALAAFDPSAHDATISAMLLVRKDSLQRLLDQSGSALVWRILGEKRAFGPGRWRQAWAGFLRLTGASVYKPGGPTGYLNTRLEIVDRH